MNRGNQTNDPGPGDDFSRVFEDERKEIRRRRRKAEFRDETAEAPEQNLVGLALAGGGIRSATFCLGLLQGLKQKNLLRIFDYLSTVSGGGYVGGWWSAWLSRHEHAEEGLFPRGERSELDRRLRKASPFARLAQTVRDLDTSANETGEYKPEGAESAGHDPIHHLRLFANYLTPRKGAFSQDTWRAVGIITRNLVMTWLVLLPIIVALVLAGQLYFVLHTQQAIYFIYYPPQDSQDYRLLRQFARDRWINEIIEEASGWGKLKKKLPAIAPEGWRSVDGREDELEKQWSDAHEDYLDSPDKYLAGEQTWLEAHPLLKEIKKLWTRDFRRHLRSDGIHGEVLRARLRIAVEPLIAIVGWILVMVCAWLWATLRFDKMPGHSAAGNRSGRRRSGAEPNLSALLVIVVSLAAAVAAVIFIFYSYYQSLQGLTKWLLDSNFVVWRILWIAVAVFLVVYAWKPWDREELEDDQSALVRSRSEMLRSRINNVYTRLLMLLVGLAMVLTVAGFGHEVIKCSYSGVIGEAKNAIGLLILMAALAGVVFTAYRTRPRGGGDKREQGRPSIASRLVFALTPWLIVSVIAFAAAWVGHGVVAHMWRQHLNRLEPALIQYTKYASVFGISLCFILALFEMKWKSKRSAGWLYASLILPALTPLFVIIRSQESLFNSQTDSLLIILALFVGLLGALFMILELRRFASQEHDQRLIGLLNRWVRLLKHPRQLWRRIFNSATPMNRISGIFIVLIYAYWLYHEISSGLQKFYDFTLLFAATLAGGYVLYRVLVIRVSNDKFRSKIFSKPVEEYAKADPSLMEARRKAGLRSTATLCCQLAIILSCMIGAFHYSLHQERQPRRTGSNTSPDSVESSPAGFKALVENSNIFEILLKPLANRKDRDQYQMYLALPSASGFAALCIFGLVRIQRKRKEKSSVMPGLLLPMVLLIGALGFFYTVWMIKEVLEKVDILNGPSNPLILTGIVICLALTRFEIKWGMGTNRRSIWLLSVAYLVLMVLLIHNLISGQNLHYRYEYGFGIFGLLVCTFTWLIGLGWLANPNVFSMHNFYRWRLVRAYLGASNTKRRATDKDITEAAPQDDVLLQKLSNCDRGAPYHLINATLNLVAGRDLAIAQRSAASFVLSKEYCGSLRTHYRPTADYMGGQLSLGTAIAVSGAAASPNMGSRTPTSALAMLMTLLNVRLGYWVPTPNQEDWRSARPRLWPFYLIREFFSQTNDLSSYCYLTDGGHFDNTGIYPLVMRGCRFIVAADCGADPFHTFNDLGDVIRLCRIDFGAQIELHIEDFLSREAGESTPLMRKQFIVGKINYSQDHIRHLTGKAEARDGIIIIFKPCITDDDGADVRQYALENTAFPHTTTTNQWFDESQFESYRRLGELCAAKLFEKYTIAKSLCHDQEPDLQCEHSEPRNDTVIESIGGLFGQIYRDHCPSAS